MQTSGLPARIPIPFANNGSKNSIPQTSQIGITAGLASYPDGFVPLNFTPIAAGGVPPFGADFNGILNAITQSLRWSHAGSGYPFDSTFASSVSGYPKGALLPNSTFDGYWFNTAEGNALAPEVSNAALTGWVPAFSYGVTTLSGLAGSSVTLTSLQAAKARIVLSGALTANINIYFPAWSKTWVVENNTSGGFAVTCTTVAGSGVIVAAGRNTVYGNGTNLLAEDVFATQGLGDSSTKVATTEFAQSLVSSTLTKSVAGGSNVILSATEARYPLLNFTGVLTANVNITVPAASRQWVVSNNTSGGFTLTVKTAAGNGVAVGQGAALQLFCDGTSVFSVGAVSAARQVQVVSAAVAANALTLGLAPTALEFRSATLSSGAVNSRAVSALSLVVPAGATLGSANAVQSRLILLALDNAGTIELAVVNLAGGVNLDETTLINTSAISASATVNNVVYSTIARAGVPFRVVGYVESSQATAGQWASAPSTIQGAGGQALGALSSLGYGQTWQNLTASRASGTTYTNTTGRPIIFSVSTNGGITTGVVLTVAGQQIENNSTSDSSAVSASSAATVVPPAATYSAVVFGPLGYWQELR
ncbi:hypothetical protein [Pseudomonas sp. GV071]|uniref:hypothetical protein n=1 Tax=Pseudomonas sp. GV071 TaxID=2135754 RepID=UPI000D3459A0|nr:hypothetical protein [Pseudomonas sp. GV071]PTQ70282.1 hypothetical protein C8K61_1064 [Pseudomonas sp. GV071]